MLLPRRAAFGVFNLAGKLLKSIAAQGISPAGLESFKQQWNGSQDNPLGPAAGPSAAALVAPGALLALLA